MQAKENRQSAQKTVKAYDDDIALINGRARQLGCTAADVIHVMCDELRKQTYLKELGESFDLAKSNKKRFADFEAEQRAWDCTLSDGLDNAP